MQTGKKKLSIAAYFPSANKQNNIITPSEISRESYSIELNHKQHDAQLCGGDISSCFTGYLVETRTAGAVNQIT